MQEKNRAELLVEVQPRAVKVKVEKAMVDKVMVEKVSAGKAMAGKKTILIVEDNAILREMLCDLLQTVHPDWCIVEAQNGLEGLKLAQCTQPDLILLDFNMPVMNGYELALNLQSCPETSSIPLVLNSAEDADHPLIMRLRTMCRAVLGKPFSLREIERIIAGILLPPHPTTPYVHVPGLYNEWGGTLQPALG